MKEKHHVQKPKIKIKKVMLWQGLSAVFGLLLVISIYNGGLFKGGVNLGNSGNVVDVPSVEIEGLSALIINDKRCDTCNTAQLIVQLQTTLPGLEIEELDYAEAKKIYEDASLSTLPAVLFSDKVKEHSNYGELEKYIEEKGKYLSLRIGASFDPNAEICDNEIDDNGDGNIDCDDSTCSSVWKCMQKQEKPVVEVFVMSYCPYGIQIEKGLIPVMETLGDKADIQIKFCDYAMHGEKELDEQLAQYCIQEEQNDKFLSYLKCFLEGGESALCVKEAGVNKDKLDSCVSTSDKEFKVTENFGDKSTWRGNFPTFNVFADEVNKYGVRGSPTLVINGVTASVGRDSASLLNAVCTGFKNKPAECDSDLSAVAQGPGFGFDSTDTGNTAAAGCGA